MEKFRVCIVDVAKGCFVIGKPTPMMKALGKSKRDKILNFATAAELVCYLADDNEDLRGPIQRMIDKRIDEDPIAKTWCKAKTLLKDLKHFPKYRKGEYDLYHAAARACVLNNATCQQKALVAGLTAEIDESRVEVPVDQILFHGRANQEITCLDTYPTFISTSLNPVVAINSAYRRAGVNNENGRPTVYVLTLKCSLPALWGQTFRSCEYELLLPPKLKSTKIKTYEGCNFDVVEAEVIKRC